MEYDAVHSFECEAFLKKLLHVDDYYIYFFLYDKSKGWPTIIHTLGIVPRFIFSNGIADTMFENNYSVEVWSVNCIGLQTGKEGFKCFTYFRTFFQQYDIVKFTYQ